ncbi:MAG: hypothetical protein LBP58_06455 [Azoarcus sp.]|nr:hypothetical protein [Azoarcus sp.]
MKNLFAFSVALLFAGMNSTLFASDKEIVPGVLEVSWDVEWKCAPEPACDVELHKNLHARFFPDYMPPSIADAPASRKLAIELPSLTEAELLKMTYAVKGVPESFLHHKERYWRVRAKAVFPEGIESFRECDNWHYRARQAIIKNVDAVALLIEDIPSGGCASRPYDERFVIKSVQHGGNVVIRKEANAGAAVIATVPPGDAIFLKLETVGQGGLWMKANRLQSNGNPSDMTGYLYLPDLLLEPLN